TTGKICLKSPPITKIMPPNGLSTSVISLNVLSTASKVNLCAIGASSQMINFVILINLANSDCLLIFNVEFSNNLIGILNLECAVLPPFSNNAAIPDEATAIAILDSDLTLAKIILNKKVFP
ncbi:hypothetical protein RhiirA5_300345, partial [Rhizophagus irregularis]